MEKKIDLRFVVVVGAIVLAAVSRLIPHPANFSPIGGMALFGAAYFGRKHWAFIVPVVAMWLSDLFLNNVVYGTFYDHFVWFYSGSLFTYAAFILIALTGIFTLKKVKVSSVLVSALSASLIFFVVSNFGVWASSGMYPHSWAGLTACYVAGLPFFGNTIAGDLCYSLILFGGFEAAGRFVPQLRATGV